MPPTVIAFYLLPLSDWLAILAGAGMVAVLVLVGRHFINRSQEGNKKGQKSSDPDPFTQGSARERRGAPRRRGNPVPILVSDADNAVTPVRGWVMDRSGGGLGLELEEEGEVDIGTVLSVRPLDAPDTVPWVKIEVRNRQLCGSTWRLGCMFVRPPAWDVMMRFG